ncbi:MAG TPA: hypothetical protein VLB68_20865 [Pyrinomonadaceae bacterium]|nr:hypothetical protein [Pyrinomonadaceae bacterium]
MPNVWTLHANGISGGSNGQDLVGCHINTNTAGTAYQFTAPNINTILSTTPGTTLPTAPFDFPQFGYDGNTWDITVNTLQGGASSNQAEGTWGTLGKPDIKETGPQSGEWTAQAGSTAGDDLAASATKSV